MGQLVLGIAGAVAGSFVGQPGLGFAIGSALGGAMFGPKQQTIRNQPQALIDLKVTGTDYGQPIPYVRGAAGIAGQVWWNSDRRAITTVTTSGGGGGKGGGGGEPVVETTTITYEIDMLIGLTDNEIVGVSRIWDNGKLIYSASVFASGTTIDASLAAGNWDRMTVYTGAADQLPDPTYEAAVGTDNAPAYRGRGSVFIQGMKLGQSGQVRNLTFEVVVDGSVGDNLPLIVFTASSSIQPISGTSDAAFMMADNGGGYWVASGTLGGFPARWLYLNLNTGVVQNIVDQIPNPGGQPFHPGFVNPRDGHAYFGSNNSTNKLYRLSPGTSTPDYIELPTLTSPALYGGCVDGAGAIWCSANDFGSAGMRITVADWAMHTCVETSLLNARFVRSVGNADAISGRIYCNSVSADGGATWGYGYLDTGSLAATVITSKSGADSASYLIGDDQNVYLSKGSGVISKYSADGALLASCSVSGGSGAINPHSCVNGVLWAFSSSTWWKIRAADMVELDTITVLGYQGEFMALSAGRPVIYNGTDKVALVNTTPVIQIAPPSLESVVSGLSLRAGLSAGQFDATGLSTVTRKVNSMALAQIAPSRAAIELLATAFFFETVTSNKIYYRPRGGSSIATIPYLDLGASQGDSQPEPLGLRQVNELEIPAQVALTYLNISDDYQQDTQLSDRLVSAAAGTVAAVQLAIGMTPSEAKAVADTILLDQAASIINAPLALLGDYCRLEPTDVVTVIGPDSSSYRMRLVKKTDSYPLLAFDAVLDDASVLVSQGITSADYSPGTVVAPAVDTLMELMDIPILLDADNDAGFYVAAKGDGTPWGGAAIFSSVNDVDYTRRVSVMESAVFGVCTTTLGSWSGARVFDEKNTVTVNVDDGTLSSSTRDAVLNSQAVNAILIGAEVIQFRTATLVSAGVYRLSGLIRGSRGTEWAMTGHGAGERCVLLSPAGLRRVVSQNSELGVSRYYKGVTLGRALSTADAETFINNAIGLKPFSPFDLRAARDGSNNITFTWQRRTRLSARLIGELGISVPLGESSEAYEVEIYSSNSYATLLRTISASSATAAYTAAEQTADGLTPGNTVYAKVFQRSAEVGRGYPLEAAA